MKLFIGKTTPLVLSVLFLTSSTALADVPAIAKSNDSAAVSAAVDSVLRSSKNEELKNEKLRSSIVSYMQFLKIDPQNTKLFKTTLQRLLQSSTQFIVCPKLDDLQCLEKKPELTPSVEFRQDTANDLGDPVRVNEPLKMEVWFTKRWAQLKRNQKPTDSTVALALADKIQRDANSGLFMAMYGIDDIQDTMAPVYKAITSKASSGVPVLGVFDLSQESNPNSFLRSYDVKVQGNSVQVDPSESLDFSYVQPKDTKNWVWGHPTWMDQLTQLDVSKADVKVNSDTGASLLSGDVKWLMNPTKAKDAIRLTFQYKDTVNLMTFLNSGIRSNLESRARIEYPADKIMHNKFLVMDNNGKKSVWSGTANIARTCMGDESNSNMSIYIMNDAVAQSFLVEFHEMFDYDASNTKIQSAQNLVTGRFHGAKRPNTKRYFQFSDGQEMAVHFAPTDDAEHRTILPMLLSARAGDRIRISMFGASGIELVRAIQYAAAQGAEVQIVLDATTGSDGSGWMKNEDANLFEANPYSATAKPIEIHVSDWLHRGSNHHKSATLTRKENGKFRTETLIVGSQNWSMSGNDLNDENVITVRNTHGSVAAGDAFNEEFDSNLWPLSLAVDKNSGQQIDRKKLRTDAANN